MPKALFVAAAAAVVAAQAPNCTVGVYPAAAWPVSHTRTEMMFEPFMGPIWSRKPIWYDFTNLNYRADVFFVSGAGNPLETLYNFSSYWSPNGTLTMVIYEDPRSIFNTTCIQLDLGFGIMVPDWMRGDVTQCAQDMFITSKTSIDEDYHRAVQTVIPVLNSSDFLGAFKWWSDYATGEGMMMQAPGMSELDYVVNEESLLTPATFAPNDPIFALPTGLPKCVSAGSPASYKHAVELVAAAGAPKSALAALPEVRLAYHLRALHRAGLVDRSTAEAVKAA